MCLSPHIMTSGDFRFRVGCGNCRQCRLRRKLAWVGRLMLEHRSHLREDLPSTFFTLTYREAPPGLDYSHIQQFLKLERWRTGLRLRFFAVGEYGSTHGRPHWHLLLFGCPQVSRQLITDHPSWPHGGVTCGPLLAGGVRYGAGYVLKPPPAKHLVPLVRASLKPGIGLAELEELGFDYGTRTKHLPPLKRPDVFALDGQQYPLHGGGRRAFEAGFLRAGGHIVNFCPEFADLELRLAYGDMGSLLVKAETARIDALADRPGSPIMHFEGGRRRGR